MTNVIGVATGSIWQWKSSHNRGELISHLRDLPIQAVELTMGSIEETEAFSLSGEDRAWLRGLPFVSIHAPGCRSFKGDRGKMEGMLGRLSDIYLDVNAKTVVFHPYDMDDFALCRPFGIQVSVENMSVENGYSVKDILAILDSCPGLFLCLDTVHAYSCSPDDIRAYVSLAGGRISHIHLSAQVGGRDHRPLSAGNPSYAGLVREVLNNTDFPILIEEYFSPYDREGLSREVTFVSSLFSASE